MKRTFFRTWRSWVNDIASINDTTEKYWVTQSKRIIDLLKMMGKKKQAQKQRQKSIRQAKKQ
eukprot:7279224-Prorocentrum_lima.AAC.1